MNLFSTSMLPTMQCDNPRTVTHLLLCFLIGKNQERGKKQNKTKKGFFLVQHGLIPNNRGGQIHDKQGTKYVGGSISKGITSVPNEITLAEEWLLILARATQSKLESKKNAKTPLLRHEYQQQ